MREVIVCRDTPGGLHCSVVVAGEDRDRLVTTLARHQETAHGIADTPALRRALLKALRFQEEIEPEERWDVVRPHPHPDPDVDDEAALRRPPPG